jgi:hypothetical protein
MTFEYIPPADIRKVWDKIKPGLEVVRRRTDEKWLDEDVYFELKSGAAQLFVMDTGFFIVNAMKNQWTQESVLHLWIAYNDTIDDVSCETHSKLRELAHNIGTNKITFTSPRRWDRRSGARIVSYNYEITTEVQP